MQGEHTISPIWTQGGNTIETPDDSYSKDVEKTIIAFKLKIIQLYLNKISEQLNDPNSEEETKITMLKQSIEAQKVRHHLMEIGGRRNVYK